MLNTVLYYELAMKVPIPVGITVYLLTWGLGHLRCLVVWKMIAVLVLMAGDFHSSSHISATLLCFRHQELDSDGI